MNINGLAGRLEAAERLGQFVGGGRLDPAIRQAHDQGFDLWVRPGLAQRQNKGGHRQGRAAGQGGKRLTRLLVA